MNFISYTSALLIALLTFGTFESPKPKKKKGNTLEIVKTWELPDALEEVSGIAWVSDAKIAAVEDEDGLIYIYDLAKNKIDKTIEFADDGDYEGIAVTGEDAYVMRSDGLLFEVQNYATAQPVTKTYQSAMSHKNNVETLSYDAKNQRLLTAPKDLDPNDEDIKGIYAFDLKQHLMLPDLVARIDMKDKAFKKFEKNKAYRTFRPSDLAIHPKTGEIYMLEGVNPKLIILDKTYAIKKVYELDKDNFAQPEGITFSPDGTLFISNEAHGGTAYIHQVELD